MFWGWGREGRVVDLFASGGGDTAASYDPANDTTQMPSHRRTETDRPKRET